VDFFTPIVDDAFLYGQIAATNSLSDVYAMGGRPLTAMNLLGVPADVVPPRIIAAILRGGAAKVKEGEMRDGRRAFHSQSRTDLRAFR
jgi:selenide,water dikinase